MKSSMNILICVSNPATLPSMLKEGYFVRSFFGGEICVLHITDKELSGYSEEISHIYEVCKNYKARMTVIKSDDIEGTIDDYLQTNKVSHVIFGRSLSDIKSDETFYNLRKKWGKSIEFRLAPFIHENVCSTQ